MKIWKQQLSLEEFSSVTVSCHWFLVADISNCTWINRNETINYSVLSSHGCIGDIPNREQTEGFGSLNK